MRAIVPRPLAIEEQLATLSPFLMDGPRHVRRIDSRIEHDVGVRRAREANALKDEAVRERAAIHVGFSRRVRAEMVSDRSRVRFAIQIRAVRCSAAIRCAGKCFAARTRHDLNDAGRRDCGSRRREKQSCRR